MYLQRIAKHVPPGERRHLALGVDMAQLHTVTASSAHVVQRYFVQQRTLFQ